MTGLTISQMTLVDPVPRLVLPAIDPAAPSGLKNVAVPISAVTPPVASATAPGLVKPGDNVAVDPVTAALSVVTGQPNGVAGLDGAGNASSLPVLAAGNGLQARSIAAKFGDLYSVMDQAAVPDGSTVNNTPFENTRLNAEASGKGAYLVPPGAYNITFAPAPSTTRPMACMLGVQLVGGGYVPGGTDGSALGALGPNCFGIAFVRPMADAYNQSVLVVQAQMLASSGTANTQKNGVYANVCTYEVSSGVSGPTKDAVAVAGFGVIGTGNPQGRAWGANFVASANGTGDGLLTGVEIDVNSSVSQPQMDQPNSKAGLTVFNLGTGQATSGIVIGKGFNYGLVFDQHVTASSTWCWAVRSGTAIIAGVDPLGRLSAASAALAGGLGAYGVSPPASRPVVTGAKGGNAALASLITALASMGLITDQTT